MDGLYRNDTDRGRRPNIDEIIQDPVPSCLACELLHLRPFLKERDLRIIQIAMQFDMPLSALYNAYFHERHGEAVHIRHL